jgi:hypothetical protein
MTHFIYLSHTHKCKDKHTHFIVQTHTHTHFIVQTHTQSLSVFLAKQTFLFVSTFKRVYRFSYQSNLLSISLNNLWIRAHC